MKSVSSTPERPIRADDAQIEQAIASLANLDHAALKERWRVLQGGDPPRRLSRQLLLRALAHAMQEKVFGGLSPMVGQRLRRLAEELRATGRISSIGKQPVFKPGTRLIREWQGRTHEVIVLEHGFQWKGETYRSLSAIARAITGTRWNGHVFFGLKSRQSPCSATDSPSDHSAAGACKTNACGSSAGRRPWLTAPSVPRNFAARSIRASPRKRAWSRSSIRCRRSARLAKPSSPARKVRVGKPCRRITTTEAGREARLTAQP